MLEIVETPVATLQPSATEMPDDEEQLVSSACCDVLVATTSSVQVQTTKALSADTPRKCRIRKKLKVLRVSNSRHSKQVTEWRKKCLTLKKVCRMSNRTSHNINSIVLSAKRYLSSESLKFFEAQLHLSKRRPRGRRYSNDMKLFALSLYSSGPKAYHFLSGIFSLPKKTTLSVWLQGMQIPPGFSDDVIHAIESRIVGMNERDRVCGLLIDEMSLKCNLNYDVKDDVVVGLEDLGEGWNRKNAVVTSALVFMARGLSSNWKQPVGYVLTNSACGACDMKQLLFNCIDKLHAAGLTVMVVISDQGTNFQQLVSQLKVSVQEPYFEHGGRRIFYMFDTPHLLKSVRNNLQKYSIEYDDCKTAQWHHIAAFFQIDQQQRFRLAPKLTHKHIELPAFSKMKVKFATAVLSRTVAAGLETHAKIIDAKASDTAEFVSKFNDIFDAVNSSQIRCLPKMRSALSDDSGHLPFLDKSIQWIANLKVLSSANKVMTATIKCVSGWQLSLSAIVKMWPVLRDEHNFQFLFTRRLNQDPLENLFSVIRQKGGKCDNPTPLDFSRLFRQVCCKNLMQPSKDSNCDIDCDKILEALSGISKKEALSGISNRCASSEIAKQAMPFPGDNVAVMKVMSVHKSLEDNGLYYVCGYFLRRLLKWHACEQCQVLFLDREKFNDCNAVYLSHRQYDGLGHDKGLLPVSESFFAYVTHCESRFSVVFDSFCHERGIMNRIVRELLNVPVPVHCNKFPKLKFLQMFVRIRIHYKVKFFNQSMIAEKKKKSRKLAKLQHL